VGAALFTREETLMLPGKKYTPEDYVRIAWKRKWLILIPTLLAAVTTAVATQYLPNRYRSEARVLIVPQRVPENFVRSTVTAGLDERLQAISQQILSRTRLEALIQEFNLYPKERETMIMEDVVDLMRRDIGVQIPRTTRREDPGYFTVRFDSTNPRTAMRVAERLASLFINENLQDREVLAQQTSQFLQTQLEDARRRLIEHEGKLEAYNRAHAGELPTQVQSNLQVLQGTQMQLQAAVDAANRDTDRRIVLDQMIADAAALVAGTAGPSAPVDAQGGRAQVASTAAQQLDSARAAMKSLELRLRPEHPDVIRAKREVEQLERKVEAELLDQPLSPGAPPGRALTGPELAQQKRLSDLRIERDRIERQLTANAAEQERLKGVVAAYRARVEAAPGRETELTELMRDYGTLQETYTSLLSKSQASDMATNLERRQIGQQFKIIEEARLPQRPISPDRPRLNLIATAAGLAFALALVALLEYRDTTFKSDDDVLVSLSLPVFAVIPAMQTVVERRQAARRRTMAWSASLAIGLCGAAVAVWRFGLIDAWVR
jgi:polysaccharide chain length determinant protein (PEP-CTERM system associated)